MNMEHMKKQNLSKGIEYIKKEPNENFRTEKYNSQSKKLNGWAQQQNGRAEERISELEDRKIDIIQSEQQRKQTEKENIASGTSGPIPEDLVFISLGSWKESRKRA